MYQQYMNQAQASLAYLSSDDLKDLLNDDTKLEERVNDVLNALESEKNVILTKNRSIAEENLTKEPDLIERRGRINDLSTEGKELCLAVQEKLAQIRSKSGEMSQDTALALLQTAAAECEEESDQIVKQLMDKELAIDAFLDSFMTSRKTMHLRKLKADKMVELVRQSKLQNSMGGGHQPYTGFYPAQPSSVPYPPAGGNVPYPMGPMMHMPMPGKFAPY